MSRVQLLEALQRLCNAVGDMPHDWPSQDLYAAYASACRVLEAV